MKKKISFLIIFSLMINMLAFNVANAAGTWDSGTGFWGTGITASVSGTTLTLSGTGTTYSGQYGTDQQTQDAITNAGITHLVIEEGITSIGSYTFYRIPFNHVTIASTVTSIQGNAFNQYIFNSTQTANKIHTVVFNGESTGVFTDAFNRAYYDNTTGWINSPLNDKFPGTPTKGTYKVVENAWVLEVPVNLIFDGNGNTDGAVPVDNTNYESGSIVTVLDNTDGLVKTGYTFAGWNTKADGTGKFYGADDSLKIGTENVTLYAQWAKILPDNVKQWTDATNNVTSPLNYNDVTSITTGDGATIAIAVGNDGLISRSTDNGVTWERQQSGLEEGEHLLSIATDGTKFIALSNKLETNGEVQNQVILTSTDGIIWNESTISFTKNNVPQNVTTLHKIKYTQALEIEIGGEKGSIPGNFSVLVNPDSEESALFSVDGSQWSDDGIFTMPAQEVITGILGNFFYMLMSLKEGVMGILSGDAGQGMIAIPGVAVNSMLAANDTFVFVGDNGDIFRTDGENFPTYLTCYGELEESNGGTDNFETLLEKCPLFFNVAKETTTNLHSVAFGQDMWVAVGDNGDILLSNDKGINWEVVDKGERSWNSVAFVNGSFVAVGDNGQIRYLTISSSKKATAPMITTQPADKTVTVGGTASLSVVATADTGTLSYQWYKNTTNSTADSVLIDGATSSTYNAPTTQAGTTYYYVVVTNTLGDSTATVTSDIAKVIVNANNNNGSSSPATNTTNVIVIVNGKEESIGQATTTTIGNQAQLTLTVDEAKLQEKLNTEGNNATIIIPVTSTNADVIVGQLNGQMVKNMEDKEATVIVQTDNASYTLPAGQINIDAISKQIGSNVDLKDININIEITKPAEETVNFVEDTAQKGNFTLQVPPVEFKVTYTSGDKSGEVSRFNAYVERTIAIPDGVDPSKITTGIVVDPVDGTTYHVPTKIIQKDGKYYAVINSLTNSLYAVVWHPLQFADVSNHWAKDAINNLGSRMVVNGVSEDTFAPNQDITRAQFAAIMVRGLGLKPGVGSNNFSDVAKDAWYEDYISTATEYNLITGYTNGNFGPNDKITRQQAFAIIARAMALTELSEDLTAAQVTSLLANLKDTNEIADYAKEYIALTVKAGIVNGRSNQTIAPGDNITRAEVAVIIERLLKKSDLINE